VLLNDELVQLILKLYNEFELLDDDDDPTKTITLLINCTQNNGLNDGPS